MNFPCVSDSSYPFGVNTCDAKSDNEDIAFTVGGTTAFIEALKKRYDNDNEEGSGSNEAP